LSFNKYSISLFKLTGESTKSLLCIYRLSKPEFTLWLAANVWEPCNYRVTERVFVQTQRKKKASDQQGKQKPIPDSKMQCMLTGNLKSHKLLGGFHRQRFKGD